MLGKSLRGLVFQAQAKKLDLTKNMDEAEAFFNSADFAPAGGRGRNEAVCDAVFEATQMAWGDHSIKVICLVGDSPPHTADDDDIKAIKASGSVPSSQFFGKDFMFR